MKSTALILIAILSAACSNTDANNFPPSDLDAGVPIGMVNKATCETGTINYDNVEATMRDGKFVFLSDACVYYKRLLGYSEQEIDKGYTGKPKVPSIQWGDDNDIACVNAMERMRNPPYGRQVNVLCGLGK